MRTPSLTRRAVLWCVGVLAALLLVTGVGVDLALGAVLRADQQDRLEQVAALAPRLTGLSDRELADRLSLPGVQARIRSSTGEVVGTPRPPVSGGPPAGLPALPDAPADSDVVVRRTARGLVATEVLRPGTTLVLTADGAEVEAALVRFRLVMGAGSLAAMLVAAALLPLVLRRALRPLDALTRAARDTAGGSRGRRLEPSDPSTDLGRAAGQFDAMLEELEGAERRAADAADRLAHFLSDASHELRTPLAGVSAGAERLIRERLDGEERDAAAAAVVREARRAARLVDDLLLVSRLDELALVRRPHPLRRLLADAAERSALAAGAPDVVLRVPDVVVLVDAERMAQVLANLLGNARQAGARQLRIRAEVVEDRVAVRVSDDGPGIPAAERDAVFERLRRLDAARSSHAGGAGLGLPIARGLVEAHGGSLSAEAPAAGDLPGAVLLLRLPVGDQHGERGSGDPGRRADGKRLPTGVSPGIS